jgi:hypothetical protein
LARSRGDAGDLWWSSERAAQSTRLIMIARQRQEDRLAEQSLPAQIFTAAPSNLSQRRSSRLRGAG